MRSLRLSRRQGERASVAILLILAAAFRLVHLMHGLPDLVLPDEPVVLDRAVGILSGRLPDQYDWPSGSMVLLAIVLAPIRLITRSLSTGDEYVIGRLVFFVVALASIVLAARLASMTATTNRRVAQATAVALVGFSFVSVRISRGLHPDHLQTLFVLFSLVTLIRYRRGPHWGLIVIGGGAAGLAFATKYLGGLVLLPWLAAISIEAGPWASKARRVSQLLSGAIVGAVVGMPALLTDPTSVADGIFGQFGHQGGGHLGYDTPDPAAWFHLSVALPGNWGTVTTVVVIACLCAVVASGTTDQRLVATYVVVAFAAVGVSRVIFPHYILLYMAPLAALAAARLAELSSKVRQAPWIAIPFVLLVLAPTIKNDVLLIRSDAATNTRTAAAATVIDLPGRVVKELYTDTSGRGETVNNMGVVQDLVNCDCFAVTSSYMEERFRREPRRYSSQIAAYNLLRKVGRVHATFEPTISSTYRWDLIPQWGIESIPLTESVGLVGPTITVYDLRQRP